MSLGQRRIPLHNSTSGASIPVIGLGTWQGPSPPPAGTVAAAVKYALQTAGYRHIDCAFAYQNEQEVGQGIKDSGVPRKEIFITSKIWCTYHRRVSECVDEILKALQTEYLDLLLIHWPFTLLPNEKGDIFPAKQDGTWDHDEEWNLQDTWWQMEEVRESGKALEIGVSNFSEYTLAQILPHVKVKPVINQIELHIYNPQHKLLEYLKSEGIVAQAYSPLGSGNNKLLKDETVVKLSEKYNVKPAQVLIGYLASKDIGAIPKSATQANIDLNIKPVELDPKDVAELDKLAGEGGKQERFVKLPWGKKVGFEDWEIAAAKWSDL